MRTEIRTPTHLIKYTLRMNNNGVIIVLSYLRKLDPRFNTNWCHGKMQHSCVHNLNNLKRESKNGEATITTAVDKSSIVTSPIQIAMPLNVDRGDPKYPASFGR